MKIAKATGNDLSRFVLYFLNPWVKVHKKIYIPFEYEELTAESLNKSLEDYVLRNTKNHTDSKYKAVKKLRGAESFEMEHGDLIETIHDTFNFKHKKGTHMLRIVSPFPIHFNPTPHKIKTQVKECEAILIHIHGGGFICQTSSQHQSYLRRWSKQNNIPVFMISYTLSPEAQYPVGLNDCWQSYRWIVDNVEQSLGLKPKKIILSGDSAGGNLATALTGLTITKGVRVPDSLILIYPALLISGSKSLC